jgi:hypothetical protein
MFVADLDELTHDAHDEGEHVRRTLFSRVMEGRGWATVVIGYEERAADGDWKGPKLTVLRMRRAGEGWKKHAQINLPAAHVVAIHRLLDEHAAAFATPATQDLDGADRADDPE